MNAIGLGLGPSTEGGELWYVQGDCEFEREREREREGGERARADPYRCRWYVLSVDVPYYLQLKRTYENAELETHE